MLQNFQFSHLNLAAINHRLTVFMQQTVFDSVKKFIAHEIIYFRGFTEFSFVSSRRLSIAGCINNISLASIRHKLSAWILEEHRERVFRKVNWYSWNGYYRSLLVVCSWHGEKLIEINICRPQKQLLCEIKLD